MQDPKAKLEDCRENFRGKDGQAYVVRCPSCHLENWAPAVASGRCAWCGWGDGKARSPKTPDENSAKKARRN